ncbi:hypothetical protein J6590_096207 [Homalodisca vitripennis]|nr:hypothetical protein J6590_096207 [Homalodisca vitripennis]
MGCFRRSRTGADSAHRRVSTSVLHLIEGQHHLFKSSNRSFPLYVALECRDGLTQYRLGLRCFDNTTHAAAAKMTSSTLDILGRTDPKNQNVGKS